MSATRAGVEHAVRFLTYAQADTTLKGQVEPLLEAHDWAGVVALAESSAFNFEALPFTEDDVEVIATPWVLLCVPAEPGIDGELVGSLAFVRSTGGALALLPAGGMVTSKDDALLATHSASMSAGAPTGSSLMVSVLTRTAEGSSALPSPWQITESDRGELLFLRNGEVRAVMGQADLRTRQHPEAKDKLDRHDGALYVDDPASVTPDEDLLSLFDGDTWTIRMNLKGQLVFRLTGSDQALHVLKGGGRLWGHAAGGHYAEDDLHFGLSELLEYLCEELLAATLGLVEDTWAAVEQTWSELEELAEEAWELAEDAAEEVADFAEDAVEEVADVAEDAAGEIVDVAEDAVDLAEGVVDEVEDVVDDALDTISDSDTWNPSNW